MITSKLPNDNAKYVCKICDYATSKTSSYKKHLLTAKHQLLYQGYPNVANHICDCGKQFKHRQGLYRHKKTCNAETTDNIQATSSKLDKDDIILELLEQNKQFAQIIIEQNKQIIEMMKKN